MIAAAVVSAATPAAASRAPPALAHVAHAGAGRREDGDTAAPVDLERLLRVVERLEGGDDLARSRVDHVARVADVDEAAVAGVLGPAAPGAVVEARLLVARDRSRELDVRDLPRRPPPKAAHV